MRSSNVDFTPVPQAKKPLTNFSSSPDQRPRSIIIHVSHGPWSFHHRHTVRGPHQPGNLQTGLARVNHGRLSLTELWKLRNVTSHLALFLSMPFPFRTHPLPGPDLRREHEGGKERESKANVILPCYFCTTFMLSCPTFPTPIPDLLPCLFTVW